MGRAAEKAGLTIDDMDLVELVDPESGKPVGEGETGELVYTSLTGRGSCILRYRTGDMILGGMTFKPCPFCGRTVPRLASQLERVSNTKNFQLSKVKGTLVNLSASHFEKDGTPKLLRVRYRPRTPGRVGVGCVRGQDGDGGAHKRQREW